LAFIRSEQAGFLRPVILLICFARASAIQRLNFAFQLGCAFRHTAEQRVLQNLLRLSLFEKFAPHCAQIFVTGGLGFGPGFLGEKGMPRGKIPC